MVPRPVRDDILLYIVQRLAIDMLSLRDKKIFSCAMFYKYIVPTGQGKKHQFYFITLTFFDPVGITYL